MISILASSPIAQSYTRLTSRNPLSIRRGCRMLHHLMVGTWTPPGAIFTFEFDDEKLTLKLIQRTAIPENEPISWMTFDVSSIVRFGAPSWLYLPACKEEYLWSCHEEMVKLCSEESDWDHSSSITSYGTWAYAFYIYFSDVKLTPS